MKNDYKALFRPGRIGSVELKNRIFKPAAEDACSMNGEVSQYLIDFYTEEAKGGTGLIICGMNVVTPMEKCGRERHPMIENDSRTPGFGRLAQTIKDNGAKACCQIGHFGSHGTPAAPELARCVSREALIDGSEEWFAMFNMLFWGNQPREELAKNFKEYTIDEIHNLVGYYGDAARRAKLAGFDMVEVHGGHRHGLGCFLSPLTNRRTDEYGGSVEKRARILYEIVEDIQKKCGKDFPIIVRLNGKDGPGVLKNPEADKNGQSIEQTVEISRKLEAMGVAALDISIQDTNVPMQSMTYGVSLEGAIAVKHAVSIPVLAAGSMQAPEFGESVLEKGQVDFIGTGRQLYADPEWPNKALRGRRNEIRPCLRCMECVNDGRHEWNGPLSCTVNANVGKPLSQYTPSNPPRNAAVVGGGPAGMEAARVLALKGNHVTLFEKRKLGGMLHEASVPEFKADIRPLITWYENQMKLLNIHVVYKEAGPEDLQGFDAVVTATGSQPITLNVPGADGANVYTGVGVLGHLPEQIGDTIIVIGGGSVGIETAIWLAAQGKKVTVIEMRDQILVGEQIISAGFDQVMIAQTGIQILTSTSLKSIQKDSVTAVNSDGKELILSCNSVVIAAGLKADHALRDALYESSEAEIYAAGDCIRPRKIYDAIHEGYEAAMSI